MKNNKVAAGIFDVESLWRDSDLCSLPFIQDQNSNKVTSVMDELLFLLCGKDDMLVTGIPFDDSLAEYLSSLDILFRYSKNPVYNKGSLSKQQNLFHFLPKELNALGAELETWESDKFSLETFGVVEGSREWCDAAKIGWDFPDVTVVEKVNSKAYSYALRKQTDTDVGSQLVSSAEELADSGKKMLDAKGSIIAKDTFGVSGKGNLLVNSGNILKTIVRYVQKQERAGKKVQFILEPFVEKRCDFTCVLYLEKNGSYKILTTQYMLSKGFAYNGTFQLTDNLKRIVDRSNYSVVIDEICKKLNYDGYFGDVCIDSMILKDDNVLPIVEINARKSMTGLKWYLDRFLDRYGLMGKFTFTQLNLPDNVVFEDLIVRMKRENILFGKDNLNAIMPLSANTLFINRGQGRLYYAVTGKSFREIEEKSIQAALFFDEFSGGKD